MKKISTLLIVAMVFFASSASAQVSSTTIGGYTYSNGSIGGQSFNSTSNRIGGYTYTNGSIGGQSFNSYSNRIGSYTYTYFRPRD